ncbi:MAG: alpha-glucosidase [Clostridia bacterium]|nr:alpha-glucosidase [Clostridia bacterium]
MQASKFNRIIYQIYPRSFRDSNGDGNGDLRGIIEKIPYLRSLGVDMVWLSPIYPSPMLDQGYDIADYDGINPLFGSMADWEAMRDALHQAGIGLIMDLVVNHTSVEHPWFRESRASLDNPRRDWYIWRKPAPDGGPPNNWRSYFGGSAWTLDEASGEYYLHLFSVGQPDLNWENPDVRAEIAAMVRRWVERGVDGFRMDVINVLSKTPGLPSVGDPAALAWAGEHFVNGPRIFDYLAELKREALDESLLTVGELSYVDLVSAIRFTEEGGPLDMAFSFEHMDYIGDRFAPADWDMAEFCRIIARWQTGIADRGHAALFFNNHDQPRLLSRIPGADQYRDKAAKMLATLLLTLEGTVFLYQGEEIGMTNSIFADRSHLRDVESLNRWDSEIASGGEAAAHRAINLGSRDHARTPMQWTGGSKAGFTDGTPWIDVNPNYREINVDAAEKDPDSILHYYRSLISLRHSTPALNDGSFVRFAEEMPALFCYRRQSADECIAVLLNLTPEPQPCPAVNGERLIGNYPDGAPDTLSPFEARVIRA